MFQVVARLFVWNEWRIDESLFAVLATVEASAEQRYAHDAEDQPEDEADEQHVEDGRYRLNEGVHDHLPHRSRSSSSPPGIAMPLSGLCFTDVTFFL